MAAGDDRAAARASSRWRRAGLSALLLALLVWAGASWFIAQKLLRDSTQRLVEREQIAAAATAASVDANVAFTLAHMRNIPKVLAKQPEIEGLLARMGPNVAPNRLAPQAFRRVLAADRPLSVLARRLEAMVGELGVDQIWVVNAAGDCIASGGFARDATATGVNYIDREYFLMARSQGSGQQFAVGRTTNVPGIYHSAAVSSGDRFLGIVVVKTNVTRLSRLARGSNVFITDENGVVIIAGDRAMLMKAIPGASWSRLPESEVRGRYRRAGFEQLAIEPAGSDGLPLFRVEGRAAPVIEAVSDDLADTLKVWVLRDVGDLARLRNERNGQFILLLLGGGSLLAAIGAASNTLLRGREHQAEIARVNAELVKLNDELRVQARFDSMTGCRNRRYFFEEVDSELCRAARFGLPCTLVMLDIDHFKQVNDRHGHPTGDALLRQFAQTVAQRLRSSDSFGRLGGEEFALLLPQTAQSGALEFAERIRLAVEAESLKLAGDDLRITVSMGVASWRGAGERSENLMARADQALYQAKNGGRNRVVAAPA